MIIIDIIVISLLMKIIKSSLIETSNEKCEFKSTYEIFYYECKHFVVENTRHECNSCTLCACGITRYKIFSLKYWSNCETYCFENLTQNDCDLQDVEKRFNYLVPIETHEIERRITFNECFFGCEDTIEANDTINDEENDEVQSSTTPIIDITDFKTSSSHITTENIQINRFGDNEQENTLSNDTNKTTDGILMSGADAGVQQTSASTIINEGTTVLIDTNSVDTHTTVPLNSQQLLTTSLTSQNVYTSTNANLIEINQDGITKTTQQIAVELTTMSTEHTIAVTNIETTSDETGKITSNDEHVYKNMTTPKITVDTTHINDDIIISSTTKIDMTGDINANTTTSNEGTQKITTSPKIPTEMITTTQKVAAEETKMNDEQRFTSTTKIKMTNAVNSDEETNKTITTQLVDENVNQTKINEIVSSHFDEISTEQVVTTSTAPYHSSIVSSTTHYSERQMQSSTSEENSETYITTTIKSTSQADITEASSHVSNNILETTKEQAIMTSELINHDNHLSSSNLVETTTDKTSNVDTTQINTKITTNEIENLTKTSYSYGSTFENNDSTTHLTITNSKSEASINKKISLETGAISTAKANKISSKNDSIDLDCDYPINQTQIFISVQDNSNSNVFVPYGTSGSIYVQLNATKNNKNIMNQIHMQNDKFKFHLEFSRKSQIVVKIVFNDVIDVFEKPISQISMFSFHLVSTPIDYFKLKLNFFILFCFMHKIEEKSCHCMSRKEAQDHYPEEFPRKF